MLYAFEWVIACVGYHKNVLLGLPQFLTKNKWEPFVVYSFFFFFQTINVV